jgi:outer membrane receptor for ferrienterochelin and colicins
MFLSVPTLMAAESMPDTPQISEVMVVTGTRTAHESWESPIPTTSISIENARKQGKQNLADVLAEQPGVEVIPAIRGQSIRLQGFDSKYVLILINGQRVTGKVGESFDLESISVEQIERVEIVRGAVSSLYGSDGIGGVVNVILRRPRSNSQDLRLRWGTDDETALGGQASFVGNQADTTLSFNLSQLEPWRRSSSPATQFSGTRGGEVSLQNNWNVTEGFSLKTRLGYQNHLIEGTDVSAAGAIWDRESKTRRSTLQISPEQSFDNGSLLKLDAQAQVYEDDYQTVARLQKTERTRELTSENLQEYTLSYQHELGSTQFLTWGLTHINEYLESDRLKSDHVERQRNSFFVQDEWSPSSSLTLVPGFRLDDDSQFGEHATGKLALRYALSEHTVLRPSFGEGYRAPAFKELYLRFENLSVGYDVIGNPDLKPEKSRSFQFAVDHRLSAGQSLSLNLFHNTISAVILATPLEQEGEGIMHYSYKNIAVARTRGADLSWRLSLGRLDAMLTWQHLETLDESSHRPLEGRSRNTLAFQISSLRFSEAWRLHLSSRWLGPQYYSTGENPQKTKSAFLASAGMLYDLNKSWTSGLTIENLSNSWEDRILQVRPRSYILTLNWNHQNERKE